MGSKTAILEMKPLTALLAGERQNGIFKKHRFCPHRPVRPLRPSSSKGPMWSKTAILEMKPLPALLAGGSQNGIFQKTPIFPSQARKAVKTLMAKRADGVQNGHFGNEALNGLTGWREPKWPFSINAVFALTGQ